MSHNISKSSYDFAAVQQTYIVSGGKHNGQIHGVCKINKRMEKNKKEPLDFFQNFIGPSFYNKQTIYGLNITFVNLILHGIYIGY